MAEHDGELPRHLLDEGEPGNRVRALAALHGPRFPRYVAVEGPDEPSISEQISKLEAIGYRVKWRMISCADLPCLKIIGMERIGTSWLPPFEHILFEIFEGAQASDGSDAPSPVSTALDAAATSLGSNGGVAASTDGRGTVLVEIGGDDAELVEATAAALRDSIGGSSFGGHRVTADGLLKL